MNKRLKTGVEPSTISVKKGFLQYTHFTTAALANSSYYSVNPINRQTNFRCPRFFPVQTNCLQTSAWD